MANIFICYNHKDRGFAELLERLLTIEGHNVYSDANLKAGEVWHLRLEKAIRQADVMIGGVRDVVYKLYKKRYRIPVILPKKPLFL